MPLRNRQGSASLETFVLCAMIAVVGVWAFAALGDGIDAAVAGQTHPSPQSDRLASGRRAQVAVASQAAALGAVADALDFVARLPARGSAEWHEFARQIGEAFHPRTGNGVAVLDTARYLGEDIGPELRNSLGANRHYSVMKAAEKSEVLEGEMQARFVALNEWIADLVSEGLSTHYDVHARWQPTIFDLRIEAPFMPSVPEWHADGRELTALMTFEGPGTERHLPPLRSSPEFERYRNIALSAFDGDLPVGNVKGTQIENFDRGKIMIFSGTPWHSDPVVAEAGGSDIAPLIHRSPQSSENPRVVHTAELTLERGPRTETR